MFTSREELRNSQKVRYSFADWKLRGDLIKISFNNKRQVRIYYSGAATPRAYSYLASLIIISSPDKFEEVNHMSSEEILGKIRKNETTEIVVRVSEYKGQMGLDIREYVTSDRYTGWSKSGVRIPIDDIFALRRMINDACSLIDPDSVSEEVEVRAGNS